MESVWGGFLGWGSALEEEVLVPCLLAVGFLGQDGDEIDAFLLALKGDGDVFQWGISHCIDSLEKYMY